MRFFRISHILLTSSLGAWVQLLDAHPMEIEKELSGSHSEREIPPILPDLNSPTTSEPNVPVSDQPEHFATGKRPLAEMIASSSSAHVAQGITKRPGIKSARG
ncbi:hypothetical protein PCASD_00521 [Puccinia coronata f. sp. avenae]|uniref:Uncharacterized protein n=1 Tax=Puccinia coronata f. sp. avenae TaxID=200324 RepID=A0A2N5SUE6_9BASI|nr:hypothetical protein PCASD_16400 [Puccinia coronata f. sp. avenae]PLW51745.1 hypothetical protein PCASD_00521 [Puccinia coronata f. sp. avenae]